MDKHTLTEFFMWCTIMNGGLLLTWSTALLVAPDFPVPGKRQMVSYFAGDL